MAEEQPTTPAEETAPAAETEAGIDGEPGESAGIGGVIGSAIGAVAAGPIGAAIGAIGGGLVGAAAELVVHHERAVHEHHEPGAEHTPQPHEHQYVNGVCSQCGEAQPS